MRRAYIRGFVKKSAGTEGDGCPANRYGTPGLSRSAEVFDLGPRK